MLCPCLPHAIIDIQYTLLSLPVSLRAEFKSPWLVLWDPLSACIGWEGLRGAGEAQTYPVQGVQPGAVSEEALQHSQWPLR